MSIKLSQEYLQAFFDGPEKVKLLIDENSVEDMLPTGTKHIGDDILLVNSLLSDDRIDFKNINSYESNSCAVLELDITWTTSDGGNLGHIGHNRFIGCGVYQWNKNKLQRLTDYGAIAYDKKIVDERIFQGDMKFDEPDARLKAKEIYRAFFMADSYIINQYIKTNTITSTFLHGSAANPDEKISEFIDRYNKFRYELIDFNIDFNLEINSVIQSANSCILESRITGRDGSGSSIEICECFISEWISGVMMNGRVYSVKVPSAEAVMESIERL